MMFALDIDSAIAIELPAPAAPGAYGAIKSRKIENGAYLVACDTEVVVRAGSSTTLRLGDTGNKLELAFSPGVVSPPVLVTRGAIVVAAKNAAGVVWLIPLVELDGHIRRVSATQGATPDGQGACTSR